MKFLKNQVILICIAIVIIVVIVILFIRFGMPYFQKKSFENERDKNRAERCISRAKDNCNGKRKVCKLYDKKGTEECQSEFDECVKKSTLKCEEEN